MGINAARELRRLRSSCPPRRHVAKLRTNAAEIGDFPAIAGFDSVPFSDTASKLTSKAAHRRFCAAYVQCESAPQESACMPFEWSHRRKLARRWRLPPTRSLSCKAAGPQRLLTLRVILVSRRTRRLRRTGEIVVGREEVEW